jgi:hypothetical protein
MYPGQEELPAEPGLEHVLRALIAEGDATELVGRQGALTMFRAARAQAATQGLPAHGWTPQDQSARSDPALSYPALSQPAPAAPPAREAAIARRARAFRRTDRRPRRFPLAAAIGAALAVACAGMAVAAYAAILPSPIQDIAHNVFAPIGVPGTAPAATAPVTPGPASGGPGQGTGPSNPSPNGLATSPAGTPSAAATCPCPGSSGATRVSMTVASNPVPFGARDVFTGHVLRNGHPGRLVRVRLLVRLSTGDGTWRVVVTGLTNANGTVWLADPWMSSDATFVLAGTGKLASVTSAPVTVTVLPHVAVRVSAADVLTVAVWPASDGDQADLQVLRGGAWQLVADLRLTAHKATYQVTPGATYRVVVPGTVAHDAAISGSVTAPASASATQSKAATATATRSARPSAPRSAPAPTVT